MHQREQQKELDKECTALTLKCTELNEQKKKLLLEFQCRSEKKRAILEPEIIPMLTTLQQEEISYQKEELLTAAKTFIKSKIL